MPTPDKQMHARGVHVHGFEHDQGDTGTVVLYTSVTTRPLEELHQMAKIVTGMNDILCCMRSRSTVWAMAGRKRCAFASEILQGSILEKAGPRAGLRLQPVQSR